MSNSIHVSAETYDRFMRLVNPLFSPDAVLRALLDLASPGSASPAGAPEPTRNAEPTAAQRTSVSVGTDRGLVTPVRRVVVSRIKRGEGTDRRVYMRHILAELARAGGTCGVDDMRQALERNVVPHLKPTDMLTLAKNPNEPRWWNHTRFARQRLVDHALLRDDSGYGKWALTDNGWELATLLLRNIDDPSVKMP